MAGYRYLANRRTMTKPKRFEQRLSGKNLLGVVPSASSLGRAGVILVTLLGWFSISNHCALGAFEYGKATATHAACHGGADIPAKSPTEGGQAPCCKTLRATFAEVSKPLVPFDASGFSLQDYFVGRIDFSDCSEPLRPLELDTGPPFSGSFAESVLQRSILAHAPPLSLS